MAVSPSKGASRTPPSRSEAFPAAEHLDEAKELQFGQTWQPPTSPPLKRPTLDGRRRASSVQFDTGAAEETKRNSTVKVPTLKGLGAQRRMSSPPPPPTYHRGISFDTFDNKDARVESFTLQYKHTNHRRTARSRTFLCGTDTKDYSEYALEWMIDELIDDGDEVICLRVVEKDSKYATEGSVERLKYRDEGRKLLDNVIRKNALEQKAISVILEFAVGRVESVIQRMIQLYEPASLVVGTRGKNLGGMQGLLPGSVSKYCLQHSPVPVIVVRPSSKRKEKKQKRQTETGRSIYTTMLNQAQSAGRLSLHDKSIVTAGTPLLATSQEAAAVEKAIGPRRGILRNRHVVSPMAAEGPEEAGVSSFALPIGFLSTESAPRADLAMKSPILAALGEWDDSPKGSPSNTSRGRSPAPQTTKSGVLDPSSIAGGEENAVDSDIGTDSDDQPTIIDHRRPSTRETTPWLNSILRQPDRPPSRHRSASRNSRSLSRDRR